MTIEEMNKETKKNHIRAKLLADDVKKLSHMSDETEDQNEKIIITELMLDLTYEQGCLIQDNKRYSSLIKLENIKNMKEN